MALAGPVLADGGIQAYGSSAVQCERIDCPLTAGVAALLAVDDRVVGALVVLTTSTSAGLVRATGEVARWVSSQLELAELDKSRTAPDGVRGTSAASPAEVRPRRRPLSVTRESAA